MKILLASLIARWAHRGQKRKYNGKPYYTHCAEVADIVRSVGGTTDAICAAYLHDTLEDTWVWEDFLACIFGERVTRFVVQVTELQFAPPVPNRDTRNKIYNAQLARGDWYSKTIKLAAMERAPRITAQLARGDWYSKTIKLADIISNLADIEEFDPKFAKVYFAEKREQLKAIGEYGEPRLRKYANHLVEDYFVRNPEDLK